MGSRDDITEGIGLLFLAALLAPLAGAAGTAKRLEDAKPKRWWDYPLMALGWLLVAFLIIAVIIVMIGLIIALGYGIFWLLGLDIGLWYIKLFTWGAFG